MNWWVLLFVPALVLSRIFDAWIDGIIEYRKIRRMYE